MRVFADQRMVRREGWRVALVPFPLAAALALALTPSVAQGTLLAGVLALFLVFPPIRSPGSWLPGLFAFLAVAPLLALLPTEWIGVPHWRQMLAQESQLVLGPLTVPGLGRWLLALPIYWGGLLFLWWCVATTLSKRESDLLSVFITLVGTGVAAAVVFWVEGAMNDPSVLAAYHVPFLSRNALGTWLVIAAVVVLGRVHRAGLEADWRIVVWLAALGLIVGAIAVCGSRSGLALLAVGVMVFAIMRAIQVGHLRVISLGVLGVLVVILGIAFGPGESARRLREGLSGPQATESFRLKEHLDALDAIASVPLTGYGIGNFSAVFPFYRSRSVQDYWAEHPDQDFLFFGVEVGAPAVLAAAAVLVLVLERMIRAMRSGDDPLAPAAVAGVLTPFIHGFWEVPLHDPPVFLLASMLVLLTPPVPAKRGVILIGAEPEAAPAIVKSHPRWNAAINRGLACLLLLPAMGFSAWLAVGGTSPLREQLNANVAGLDRHSWSRRGEAALLAGDFPEARRAYGISRFLDPVTVAIAEEEAFAWLRSPEPELAAPAVKASVGRSVGSLRWQRLQNYLGSTRDAGARETIYRSLDAPELSQMIVWTEYAGQDEFPGLARAISDRLRAGEPVDDRIRSFFGEQLERRAAAARPN